MNETICALIVDDEDALRFFIQETLRRAGINSAGAASGEQALDLLRDQRYDLAILDLMLGGRVDGLKVLEAIRWRWPDMAVVILTAHGSLESAMAAIREGVDGYLLKPVEPAELRQAVQEAMERRRGLLHGIKSIEKAGDHAWITTHCGKIFLVSNSRNSRSARWLRNKWFKGACGECRVPDWKLEKYASTEFKRHYGSDLKH